MSETVDQSTACIRDGRSDQFGCQPGRVLDLLTDEAARAVYLSLDEPQTVRDLSESLDLPSSTTYRKVTALHESGLITQLGGGASGGTATYYVQATDRVSVTFDDPLRIECERNGTTVSCEPESMR